MEIPTCGQCLNLMERTRMPPHIQRHSMLVARIALCLGRLLNRNSLRLNLELIEAGALLHDIAKARSLLTGERHHVLGAGMVKEWGYSALAPIVREHVSLESEWLERPITESLVVNYADKRVKHDQIVSLKDRFDDLIERYARTAEHQIHLQQKLELFIQVERKIFDHLSITPDELMQSCPENG